jgi:NAD(P)-dependent dehydrogenase (short-subunit alcohol dehydrogenase family)
MLYKMTEEQWNEVVDTHLKGPFLCTKAVFPQMKKQGKGKIINVSSGTFYKGLPNFLHYVVSKGGNVALTRSLAREVGDQPFSYPSATITGPVSPSGPR